MQNAVWIHEMFILYYKFQFVLLSAEYPKLVVPLLGTLYGFFSPESLPLCACFRLHEDFLLRNVRN